MLRRYVESSRTIFVGVSGCVALMLAACGSSPTTDLPSTATAAEPQVQDAASAVTTAPLKDSSGNQTATGAQSNTQKPARGEVASGAAPVAPEPALPAEAVQQFDKAVVHMSAGDTATAEQEFKSMTGAYPTFAGPWINLGILQSKSGHLDDAEKSLKAAIERGPNNATAYNQLGIVYRKLGRFKEADEAYQHAIQVDPNYANAYLNLGVLCDLYLQQPQRALEAYEHYLSLAAAPDKKVSTWVTELKKRAGVAEQKAGSEG